MGSAGKNRLGKTGKQQTQPSGGDLLVQLMLCGSAVVLVPDRSSSGELWCSTVRLRRRLTVLRRRPVLNCSVSRLSADCVCLSVLCSVLFCALFLYFWYFHRPGFPVVVMAPAERRTAAPSRILKLLLTLLSVFRSFQIFPSAGDRCFWVSGRCRAACFPPGSVRFFLNGRLGAKFRPSLLCCCRISISRDRI